MESDDRGRVAHALAGRQHALRNGLRERRGTPHGYRDRIGRRPQTGDQSIAEERFPKPDRLMEPVGYRTDQSIRHGIYRAGSQSGCRRDNGKERRPADPLAGRIRQGLSGHDDAGSVHDRLRSRNADDDDHHRPKKPRSRPYWSPMPTESSRSTRTAARRS